MYLGLFILFHIFVSTGAKHFNGGTIGWAPIDPYDNSTSVDITITQSYSWTYPYTKCANNVPISTSGFGSANTNLTCVVDCSTDGNYSSTPIDILTNCTSASSSLKMMTSERSKNITLSADAHFYLAYRGTAWVPLNDPAEKGLDWSIVTYIDLRKRPDGFINTPSVAKFVSPQYAIVNKTIQINIPVSDVNTGDDVRCRCEVTSHREFIHIRNKRSCSGYGTTSCLFGCSCTFPSCVSTTCTGSTCTDTGGCNTTVTTTTTGGTTTTVAATTTGATTTTAATTTNAATTIINITTTETPETPKSTSSFPIRQAIDECADICYPNSVPSGTTLSNCTITFTGTKAGVWYAVAIQVEDFIDTSSTTPMSSVPVQFLIYVQSQTACSLEPIIIPLDCCLEVQVGVSIRFNLSALNLCNQNVATLTDIVVSSGITGMTHINLTHSSTNSSIYYMKFTWTPQANQIGSQQLCTVAYTSENLQSDQYCVTFTVKNSSDTCVTTTTTTTSTSTTTTSETTTTSTATTSEAATTTWTTTTV
ncbi:unnamed protein product [Rotaria sp. Silwood2]|nr:unnamed protein product [Rotaria sp. Silwood2]